MSLRDPEFIETLGAFKAASLLDDSLKVAADKVRGFSFPSLLDSDIFQRLRVAIMQ